MRRNKTAAAGAICGVLCALCVLAYTQSVRGEDMGKYLTPRGFAILDALHAVAGRHEATASEVALAWVMAQRGVTAPIASATRIAHVESFARAAELRLSVEDMALLDIPAG